VIVDASEDCALLFVANAGGIDLLLGMVMCRHLVPLGHFHGAG
jgi:hypothetical protein